jgi:1-deoxy-D-xylulose-5-phosphate synthase
MVKRMGIPDHFIQHGPVNALYSICGIDQTGIYNTLIHILNS